MHEAIPATLPDPLANVPKREKEEIDRDAVKEELQGEIIIEAEGSDDEGANECDWYAAQGEEENDEELTKWDETCIAVRQGQLQIDMMDQDPKLSDDKLLAFCEWLSRQLGVVVSNYPYVRRSGATVDLSGNQIGPRGLDRVFTVLRDHRVPCVTIKAYRNLLDDSIVNTLVEYLYTQPEKHPIHGIHMSHNQISNKGALRLVKAADQCGHYPRKLTRQPLWLRLENNAIEDPEEFVRECQRDGVRLCVMIDGMCSSPTCDHLKNVAVQLPHFFNQGRNKGKGKSSKGKMRSEYEFMPKGLLASKGAFSSKGTFGSKGDFASKGAFGSKGDFAPKGAFGSNGDFAPKGAFSSKGDFASKDAYFSKGTKGKGRETRKRPYPDEDLDGEPTN